MEGGGWRVEGGGHLCEECLVHVCRVVVHRRHGEFYLSPPAHQPGLKFRAQGWNSLSPKLMLHVLGFRISMRGFWVCSFG